MTVFQGKIKNLTLRPSNQQEWLDYLEKNDDKSVWWNIERETGVRTPKQNDSLHLYFEMLAKELNDAGLDMKKVLEPSVDIEWTKENIKEYIWRPLQIDITGKKSTKDLDKATEITKIWETLNRHLSQRFKVSVPFPTNKKEEFDIPIAYPQNNLKPTI